MMVKEKWICDIHDQREWTCVDEQGYKYHVKHSELFGDMSAERKIFERMVLIVGAFDEKDQLLLARAMRYADTNIYTLNPKSMDEKLYNEIFEVKAASYYQRKQLEGKQLYKEVDGIRRHEHQTIIYLKQQIKHHG